MTILINHSEVVTHVATLDSLADELKLPTRGVAIAINNRVIPRTEWGNTTLEEGMSLTIINAAFGG